MQMHSEHYISLASLFACATWASRWLRNVICVPCWPPDFLVLVVAGTAGATEDWERDSRVSSDAKPGIRILWFRSTHRWWVQCSGKSNDLGLPRWSWRSRTSRVSPCRCFVKRHAKFVTESMNSSAIVNNNFFKGVSTSRAFPHGDESYIFNFRVYFHIGVNARH